ncbi:hypothetical protein F4X88_07240 [Candidatus Poribacteria bacterium]|nr:hypothetical protein [Candidatus Poribacteria bacterium]
MKVRILYASIIGITGILTILIFFDFYKQWKATEDFQIERVPLSVRHLFIAPEQLKIEDWQVGESAVYHLQTNRERREISFSIAARDREDMNRFWLKTDGLLKLNKKDIEIWRLLDHTNLRPGIEQRGFYFIENAIPFPFPALKFPPNPIVIERLGNQAMLTSFGTLDCEHVLAYIRSSNGELDPLLEMWTHPAARPLGLVRARWRDGSMDLIEVQRAAVPEIPNVLLSEFDRSIPLKGSCSRCHTDGIGGKSLKLEFIDWLSGEELNLTTALFHHRQASLFQPKDLIHIQLTDKSWRTRRRALAKFSWENGSFWVKPNRRNKLGISLDTAAHQGNITVQANAGRLALDIGQ